MGNIAGKSFAIVSEGGSVIYGEGQAVPDHIAQRFPQYIQGYVEKMQPPHNPNLPEKLSKKEAQKLTEDELMQWIAQYRSGKVPEEGTAKADLVEIVMQLQG